MSKEELKNSLHLLIDVVDDEQTLELMYDVFTEHIPGNDEKDILDSLTPDQQKRLELSLKQAKEGKTVSDSVMRERIKEWLTK